MRRSLLGRTVPAILTIVGAAIPAGTAATILLHAMSSSTAARVALPTSSSGSSVAAVVTPTPKAAATVTRVPTAVSTRTVAGSVVKDPYGQVQATITVTGNKITNVAITAPEGDPKSARINQQAVPTLQSETLQAQSVNVNLISGATITSEAYVQSLQSAIQAAGL